MNSKSLVFSHQRDVVIELSRFFDKVEVFTTETSSEFLPKNVKVFYLPWKVHSPLQNVFTILKLLYPTLIKSRTSVLFNHMTDIHASIVAPLTWLLRMRHVLWYAHANNSRYLIFSSFFVSKIVSSTYGSCKLKLNRGKVRYINQGISHTDFFYRVRTHQKLYKILYYGRLDPSKNIHLFPRLINELKRYQDSYTLTLFGKPSNDTAEKYLLDLKSLQKFNSGESSITLNGPIERALIADIAKNYDIFVNLFSGSLDKTLIEATFMGMPVVTWNREYCSEFGTWSGLGVSENLDFIINEFKAISSLKGSELDRRINKRLQLARKSHSFEGWINQLVGVLKEGKS
jgi:glycosyltransferase involved in cell wall biosynthesis